MNIKKSKGASLIYVLIILSIITIFTVNFIYFLKERSNIAFVKKSIESRISKKYLEKMEEKNGKRILKKGILKNGVVIIINKKEDYFDSSITRDINGNSELTPLLYLRNDENSIGGFHIKEIKNENGNILKIPLQKNRVYKNLEIVYEKEVLKEKIYFKEKIDINRMNALKESISIISSGFIE